MSAGASASEAMREVPETSRNEPPRTIVLKSADGQEFEVDLAMAKQSGMIKRRIDAGCVERCVPLANVDGPGLAMVVEYWKQRASGKEDGDLKELVKRSKEELFEVIMAAKYLDIAPLLDLCCQAVADTIKNMSVEDAQEYFGIVSDSNPGGEATVSSENDCEYQRNTRTIE